MKGYRLLAQILAFAKIRPRTIPAFTRACETGYIPVMRAVNELRAAGLLVKVSERPAKKGPAIAMYGLRQIEATLVGRVCTRQFLRLWNALIEPDSVAEISAELGLTGNYMRITIHMLRRLKLCRVADWQRGHVSIPTALYALGSEPDAPRPQRQTEKQYNDSAAQQRRQRAIYDALTWRIAA